MNPLREQVRDTNENIVLLLLRWIIAPAKWFWSTKIRSERFLGMLKE